MSRRSFKVALGDSGISRIHSQFTKRSLVFKEVDGESWNFPRNEPYVLVKEGSDTSVYLNPFYVIRGEEEAENLLKVIGEFLMVEIKDRDLPPYRIITPDENVASTLAHVLRKFYPNRMDLYGFLSLKSAKN